MQSTDLLTLPEQIARIQAQLNANAPKYNLTRMPVTMAELEEVIKRVFDEKLAELSKSQVAETQKVEPCGGSAMLSAIGSALTEDQQLWLSKPDNQDKIVEFLNSANGQALTRRFFTTYKDYKEQK